MKKIFFLFITLFFLMNLIGCSDECYLAIDSLSADGNEFYCNQKVKLWMCVKSSDLWHTDYRWSCDGGTFTEPQGLDEMTWQAPEIPGIYTVKCTVTVGNKSETREHQLKVSSYYFEKFEKTPYSFAGNGVTINSKQEIVEGRTNGYIEAFVKSTSATTGYLYHDFNDLSLMGPPFSVLANMGYIANMPTTDTIKRGSKRDLNKIEFQLNCLKDPEINSAYINQISFSWVPTGVEPAFPNVPTRWNYVNLTGGTKFNAIFRINIITAQGSYDHWYYFLKIDKMSTFTNGMNHKVGIGIDTDYRFYVYLDSEEVWSTDLINERRTINEVTGNFIVKDWRIYITNGNQGVNPPLFYFDNAYASKTEILK